MTYKEFFEKVKDSLPLYDEERRKSISILEEKLKFIEDPMEKSMASKVLEDLKERLSAFKKELQEAANHGDGYAQKILQLLDCATEGKDNALYQGYYIDDIDYLWHYNYKKLFVGLDDINVINKYQFEEAYASIYLAQMGNVPDDEIAPVKDKYQIGYNELEKYKFQIAETITKKIQELADATWQIGNSVNEEKLEDLIRYINIPYKNQEIQSINSKNVKRIFKEFIEAFNLDTDEWIYTDIDIYSDKFKNLCKIHIYLPIEGEVTGVYFFERYYGKNGSKNASVNFLEQIVPNNNENKPQDTGENILSIEYYSSETEKEITACLDFVNNSEKLKMVKKEDKKTLKEIKNYNGYIKDKQQKRYDSYKENFPKIYDFSLDNYPEEEVTKLGDLLNYIEYDLLAKDKNSSNKAKLSKKLNIFLMLKSPAIEIFEKFPSKNIAERDCFIFLKSEFLRHIELSDILVLRERIKTAFELLLQNMKSAAYFIIENAVIYKTMSAGLIKTLNPDEIIKDYKMYSERLIALKFEENHHSKKDNIFFDFLLNIVIDEYKFELKMRNKNIKSVVNFNSKSIAKEIPDFKDSLRLTLNAYPKLPLVDASKIWQPHHSILVKYFLEKLQCEFISLVSCVIIVQLCKFADNIQITLSKSYRNTRVKTLTLKELLKSDISNKEITRILSYLIEKQFYYNVGYGTAYEVMNDFRVVLESKALDSIKNNLDKLDKTDYDISISKIFREKYKDLLKNRLVDFDLNITLPDLIASSDWDTFLNSISIE